MKRFHHVNEEEREPIVIYDKYRGLLDYIHRTSHYVLPSSSKKLLEHFSSFSEFIDTLSDEVHKHCLHLIPEKQQQQNQSSNNNNNTDATVIPITIEEEIIDDGPIIPWYTLLQNDTGSVEEEEETAHIISEEEAIETNTTPLRLEEVGVTEAETIKEVVPIVMTIDISKLLGRAWEWHNDVIERKNEILTSFYAFGYMLSWVSFCRLFYLSILRDSAKYEEYNNKAPSNHAYNQSIQDIACIVVTDALTSAYTIREMWDTTSQLLPTLYARQYTSDMKEYTQILLFRYSSFLAKYFTEEDDDILFDDPSFVAYRANNAAIQRDSDMEEEMEGEEDEGEEEEDDEDEFITETFDEYKSMTVPVHTNYSIKSRYVLEGELLFYSQLMRLNLCALLHSIPVMPLAYNQYAGNYSEILTRCLDALCEMITTVTSDKVLRYETNECFKSKLSHAHIYHGERERFSRLWPESNNEPGDVIERFRPNDNLKISETRRLSVPMICAAYLAEMQETILRMKDNGIQQEKDKEPIASHNMYSFYYTEYEREIVLLAHVTTTEWLNYRGLKNVASLRSVFIIEEMRPLADIDQIIISHRERNKRKNKSLLLPYLVKLVQVYHVIDINQREIQAYRTHFFAEAYILWLSICCKYKLVPFKEVHDILKPMVNTLQEFLL